MKACGVLDVLAGRCSLHSGQSRQAWKAERRGQGKIFQNFDFYFSEHGSVFQSEPTIKGALRFAV
jgi:hypothetical protein